MAISFWYSFLRKYPVRVTEKTSKHLNSFGSGFRLSKANRLNGSDRMLLSHLIHRKIENKGTKNLHTSGL
jgi:hypothetical protein